MNVKLLSTKTKIALAAAIIFLSIVLINTIGREAYFCNGGKYKLVGSACWIINYSSSPRLQTKTADGEIVKADFKIPFFVLEKVKYALHGPHSVISLELKIQRDNKSAIDAFAVLRLASLDEGNGLIADVNNYTDKKSYQVSDETELFLTYQNFPVAHGNKYVVPKNQPARQLYLTCMKRCTLRGLYRNTYYTLSIPHEWMGDYLELQKIMESFLDSVLLENGDK